MDKVVGMKSRFIHTRSLACPCLRRTPSSLRATDSNSPPGGENRKINILAFAAYGFCWSLPRTGLGASSLGSSLGPKWKAVCARVALVRVPFYGFQVSRAGFLVLSLSPLAHILAQVAFLSPVVAFHGSFTGVDFKLFNGLLDDWSRAAMKPRPQHENQTTAEPGLLEEVE